MNSSISSSSRAAAADYRSFVGRFALVVALIILAILGINSLIDPLWYFGGNRYSGINYSFNERASKLNLFLKAPKSYDCIIFGASEVTLLNEDLVNNHHCFNFAFSAGSVLDFIDYAKYIKALGVEPKLVIVGVNLFDFQTDQLQSLAPDEVKMLAPPPSALQSYLTWDALMWSLQTIRGEAIRPRNYDKNFKGAIIGKVSGDQKKCVDDVHSIFCSTSLPPIFDHIKYYKELRSIFSRAKWVGFASYRSLDVTAKLEARGHLDQALYVTYQVSRIFDRFYDFSMPSAENADPSRTYDGYHFSPDTMNHIAEEINGDSHNEWLHLHEESFETYREEYERRLDDYRI